MTQIDPERQNQAKQYARIKRRLWVVDQAFSLIYALLWLILGWSTSLREWIMNFTQNPLLLVASYAIIFGGIYYVLNVPLSYLAEFVYPHRFKLSTQSQKDWLNDQLKSLGIGTVLGLILIEVIYFILRVTGDVWWLWLSGAMLVFSVLLVNLSPVLIMPIFNKFTPLSEEHADLEERLIRLAEEADTDVKGVYKMDMSRRTRQANAALMGIGNTRRIVLGDTLIEEFSPDEIETVLAHELGHHVNHDLPILIGFSTVLIALGFFLVSLAMNWAVNAFGLNGVADPAGLPVFMILLSVYQLVVMPVSNAFSRWRERMADDYALQATKKPRAFASAFKQLANQNLGEVDPEPWVVFLFYNHPPLRDRIAKADHWQKA